ncbi:hypothetical protein B0H13DRAFT_1915225 [Mycena leptocephala]|nr:hypothetical protein B0H13DRAFT_1915225 [Mycena leptocephala]
MVECGWITNMSFWPPGSASFKDSRIFCTATKKFRSSGNDDESAATTVVHQEDGGGWRKKYCLAGSKATEDGYHFCLKLRHVSDNFAEDADSQGYLPPTSVNFQGRSFIPPPQIQATTPHSKCSTTLSASLRKMETRYALVGFSHFHNLVQALASFGILEHTVPESQVPYDNSLNPCYRPLEAPVSRAFISDYPQNDEQHRRQNNSKIMTMMIIVE